ncbi:MAG TPA: UDP-glucose/GDP-mannose dehydrogenase family protein [Candidatus Limnocylindrales bacterium]|nr:UDP-glucose/GDP-mannose dehydrogenase family protein [Candidatus Limnocylindrales bacterium]
MRISVIGAGYVGLVTGACLAELGHHVLCTDNDKSKIDTLDRGKLPIFEPGLDRVVEKNRKQGRLSFSADPARAATEGEAIFICVGTPPLPTGDADLSSIDRVAQMIATEAKSDKLVVEKSTVPAQTGQQLKRVLEIYGRGSGARFRVASNPEFLREGTAVSDFLHPDRIVIGVSDEVAEKQLHEIYRPVLEQKFHCPVHDGACPPSPPPAWLVTTINSAELIKHASNSFLALKISYANMVADLAEKLGANIEEVMHGVGLDPRIGAHFFRPGLGFGGFCLPKDLQAFVRLAERNGVDFAMLREAERINHQRIAGFVEKLRHSLWVLKGKQIAMLGLAFKANTDDIRFAPSIELIKRLQAEGVRLSAYDPQAMEKIREQFPDLNCATDAYEAARGADALLIVTEWEEFRKLDWARIHKDMARPLVMDGRNLLSAEAMKALGFEYHSIGRPDLPVRGETKVLA